MTVVADDLVRLTSLWMEFLRLSCREHLDAHEYVTSREDVLVLFAHVLVVIQLVTTLRLRY